MVITCKVCSKVFTSNDAYNAHIDTDHASIACKYCSRKFVRPADYADHLDKAHQARPEFYACNIGHEAIIFGRYEDFTTHAFKEHSIRKLPFIPDEANVDRIPDSWPQIYQLVNFAISSFCECGENYSCDFHALPESTAIEQMQRALVADIPLRMFARFDV